MKFLIVLTLAAFAAANTDPIEEYLGLLKTIHEDCLTSTGCDKDILKQHLTKGDVDDPKLREYLLCSSKKRGYRNEEGVYQPEVHKKTLMKMMKDEKKVDDMMTKCVIKKDTPGESCLLSSRCFAKEVYDFIAIKRRENFEEFTKECKTETGVTDAAVAAVMEGNESTDPKIKMYTLCMMKKMHGMSESGEMNINVIKASLFMTFKNKDKVHEIVEKCCKKMDTPEETSYHYAVCRYKLSK